MKRLVFVLPLVLLITFAFPSTVMAGGFYDGKVVLGTNYVLASGEELDGDLLVFGGNVTLMSESRVRGDVVVFGGNVDSNGEITGDLAVLGGYVELNSEALVQGDVILLGGEIRREEGSRVLGNTVSEQDFNVPFDFEWIGPDFRLPRFRPASTAIQGLWFLFRSFMMAALAVLVVMFAPDATKRVGKATIGQPLLAGGLGLLSVIVIPILLLILTILIITIPLVLIAVIALVVAVVFGWIGIGLEVGERLGEAFNWDLHPAAAAGLGTFLFSIVIWGIGFIPCVGWIAPAVMYCVAFGSILLTRFGTQSYTFKSSSVAMVEAEVEETPEPEETEEE